MPKAENYVETYVREHNLAALREIKKHIGWSEFTNKMIELHGQEEIDKAKSTSK